MRCVPPWEWCDGVADCPLLAEDEVYCNLYCPHGCICHGHTYSCDFHKLGSKSKSINYNFQSKVIPKALSLRSHSYEIVLDFMMVIEHDGLFFLNLSQCSIQKHISFFLGLNFTKLIYLDLSHNDIKKLSKGLFHMTFLQELRIQYNAISYIEEKTFENLPNLECLYMEFNDVQTIEAHFFKNLYNLKFLDLRGNPLVQSDSSAFLSLHNLQILHADLYQICCLVISRNVDCLPITDGMASCSNLFESGPLRALLFIFSIAALSNIVILGICLKQSL